MLARLPVACAAVSDEPDLLSPPKPATWDALVAEATGGTVFHKSLWAHVWMTEWPGARWQALVLPHGGGYAAGLGFILRESPMGRRILAMPDGTYGGPIVRRDHPDPADARRRLLAAFARLASGSRVLAAQLTWPMGARAEVPKGVEVRESLTLVVPLDRKLDARIRGVAANEPRPARQPDWALEHVTDEGGVRAYHDLVSRSSRQRRGAHRPLSFYLRILEHLVPAGLARYDLVRLDGAPVAGSLHLLSGGAALNWLTVSDERHWRLRPNHLILATVMREMQEAGYREYDFLGSPAGADGLIQFKQSWGAVPKPVLRLGRRSLIERLFGRYLPGNARFG